MDEFVNIEFHRSGYGMLPDMQDKDPGMPICIPRNAGGGIFAGRCDCRAGRKGQACAHFERLVQAARRIKKHFGNHSWGEVFNASVWYRLAAILSEGDAILCPDIRVARSPQERAWSFLSPRDVLLARSLDESEGSLRLLERIGKTPPSNRFRDRAARFATKDTKEVPAAATEDVRRIIAPFILRRLKSAVLKELPEKIEDLRTCELSEAQVGLYRDAIIDRKRRLTNSVVQADDPHLDKIFTRAELLDLLHPV